MKSYTLNGVPNGNYLAGVAETGDMVINNIAGVLYFNRGTMAAPDWIEIDSIGGGAGGSVRGIYSPVTYGAVGDGVTDDTAAFTALLAAIPTGGIIDVSQGVWRIPNGLTIPSDKQIKIQGSVGSNRLVDSSSKIVTESLTGVGIQVNSSGCVFHHFALVNNAVGTVIAGAGIKFALGDHTLVDHILVAGYWNNIEFNRGCYYQVANSHFHDCWQYGAYLENPTEADHGDPAWTGNVFTQLASIGRNALAAVRWRSGGGFRFVNNKINGFDPLLNGAGVTGKYVNGLHFTIQTGKSTSVMVITGNSIEGCTVGGGCGITIEQETAGTGTGSFGKIVITSNEIAINTNGISVTGSSVAQIYGLHISGNIFTDTSTAIGLSHVDHYNIGENIYRAVTTPISEITNCTNGDVTMPNVNGDNKFLYSNASRSATIHQGTNQRPLSFGRELPTINSNVTWVTLWQIQTAANSTGIVEFSAMGNGYNVMGEFAVRSTFVYTRHGTGTPLITIIGTDFTLAGAPGPPANSFAVDYQLDLTTNPGYIRVQMKLNSGASALDLIGNAYLTIRGVVASIKKGI